MFRSDFTISRNARRQSRTICHAGGYSSHSTRPLRTYTQRQAPACNNDSERQTIAATSNSTKPPESKPSGEIADKSACREFPTPQTKLHSSGPGINTPLQPQHAGITPPDNGTSLGVTSADPSHCIYAACGDRPGSHCCDHIERLLRVLERERAPCESSCGSEWDICPAGPP